MYTNKSLKHDKTFKAFKFTKKLRLRTKDQIKNVFDKKQKLSQNFIAIFFCHNNLDHARLGIIIPKKNVALAATRNRIKRIVRESFRLNQEKIKGFDIIVFAYAGAGKSTNTNKDLRLCLEKQWTKLTDFLPK